MKLATVITIAPVPKGGLNDKSTHLMARDGFLLERQKNGDVTVTKAGRLVGFIGASNIAWAEPLAEET